jgi:hypothetical protein
MEKITLLLVGVLLLAVSCGKNEEADEIPPLESAGYKHIGADPPFSEELTLTADSLHYSYQRHSTMPVPPDENGIHIAIPERIWRELLDLYDLETLARIKNGESLQPLDGTDEILTIKTRSKEWSFINGYGEEYEKFHEFFNNVLMQLSLFNEGKRTTGIVPRKM